MTNIKTSSALRIYFLQQRFSVPERTNLDSSFQIVIQIGDEIDGMVMIRNGDHQQGVCPVKYLQEIWAHLPGIQGSSHSTSPSGTLSSSPNSPPPYGFFESNTQNYSSYTPTSSKSISNYSFSSSSQQATNSSYISRPPKESRSVFDFQHATGEGESQTVSKGKPVTQRGFVHLPSSRSFDSQAQMMGSHKSRRLPSIHSHSMDAPSNRPKPRVLPRPVSGADFHADVRNPRLGLANFKGLSSFDSYFTPEDDDVFIYPSLANTNLTSLAKEINNDRINNRNFPQPHLSTLKIRNGKMPMNVPVKYLQKYINPTAPEEELPSRHISSPSFRWPEAEGFPQSSSSRLNFTHSRSLPLDCRRMYYFMDPHWLPKSHWLWDKSHSVSQHPRPAEDEDIRSLNSNLTRKLRLGSWKN